PPAFAGTHQEREAPPLSSHQYLRIKIFYAASAPVLSSGRSTSLTCSNLAPGRTSAIGWGAFTARSVTAPPRSACRPWRFPRPCSGTLGDLAAVMHGGEDRFDGVRSS